MKRLSLSVVLLVVFAQLGVVSELAEARPAKKEHESVTIRPRGGLTVSPHGAYEIIFASHQNDRNHQVEIKGFVHISSAFRGGSSKTYIQGSTKYVRSGQTATYKIPAPDKYNMKYYTFEVSNHWSPVKFNFDIYRFNR